MHLPYAFGCKHIRCVRIASQVQIKSSRIPGAVCSEHGIRLIYREFLTRSHTSGEFALIIRFLFPLSLFLRSQERQTTAVRADVAHRSRSTAREFVSPETEYGCQQV